jgi:hypothetical protein
MKNILSLVLLASVLLTGTALAADPVLGTWKLNVQKSKFNEPLTGGTRVYTEANGVYTLEQKLTGADGKEMASHAQYSDGKDMKQTLNSRAVSTHAHKIDANTWDFELKTDGKVVGTVHRVVSADGKVLTVHNSGMLLSGKTGDETLVFDKQ